MGERVNRKIGEQVSRSSRNESGNQGGRSEGGALVFRNPQATVMTQGLVDRPYLSKEEERKTAQWAQAGIFARAALSALMERKSDSLRQSEIEELLDIVATATEKEQEALAANKGLIISLVKRNLDRGIPFADLFQVGCIGFIKAIRKFDLNKGVKLTTYATWWIRQSINREIANNSRVIRLPVHIHDRERLVFRAINELTGVLGRVPSVEEVAAKIDWSIDQLETLMQQTTAPASLDQIIGDSEVPLSEFIDSQEPSVEAQAARRELDQEDSEYVYLYKWIAKLYTASQEYKDRNIRIYLMLYGWLDGHKYTQAEVAECFGLSTNSINKISRAIRAVIKKEAETQGMLCSQPESN